MGDEMGNLTHGVDDDTLARLAAFAAQLPPERKDDSWSDPQAASTEAPAPAQGDGGSVTTPQAPAPAVSPETTTGTTSTTTSTTPDEAAIVALWDWDAFNADLDLAEAKALDTDADPSPNPGAAKLRRYWTRGPGAAKIGWGSSGDYLRCVSRLSKYVGDAKGLCNVYHVAATGSPPGKGHKDDQAGTEEHTVGVETKTSMKADGSWDFDAVDMGLLPPSTGTDLNGPTGDASEYKEVGAQVIEVDKRRGIVTAIVSVTGKKDRVDDVIHPGAYKKTLADRTPKGVWSHSWEQPVSKTLEVDELQPGDSRLPKEMRGAVGAPVPWPAEAGGLLVKTQFNLLGDRGKQAFADVVFFGDQQEWSIGYKVPPGGSQVKGGTRHIYDLELYEYSPVLFGAMPAAATMTVKSAQAAFKAALTADELAEFASLQVEVKAFDESSVTRNEDGEFAPEKGSGYKAKGKDDATVAKEQMSTKQVQERLVKLGILGKDSGKNGGVDGLFGPKTEAALKKFQRDNGLPESGKADKATMAKLAGGDAPKPDAAPAPAEAGAKVPLADRPSDGAKPETNYDDGTGTGWDYKPGPSAVSSKGKVAEDGVPTATPAKGKPVGQVDGDMVYDDGAKFTAKGWSEDVVPAATVKKLAEERNAKRASAGMAPIPVPTYATTGKSPLVKPAAGKKEADVDPETKTDVAGWPIEEFKAAFPGAAPPFGSKPGKGKDEDDSADRNDDGDKPDAGKPHKFDKGPGGKCKTCGKNFAGHMAAQRESATGDSKALQDLWDDAADLAADEVAADEVATEAKAAAGKCPQCGSTEINEYADGTAECDDCGASISEAKALPVSLDADKLVAFYNALGGLLGKSAEPTVEVEVPAKETIEVPVEEPPAAPAPTEEKALLTADELAEMRALLA